MLARLAGPETMARRANPVYPEWKAIRAIQVAPDNQDCVEKMDFPDCKDRKANGGMRGSPACPGRRATTAAAGCLEKREALENPASPDWQAGQEALVKRATGVSLESQAIRANPA